MKCIECIAGDHAGRPYIMVVVGFCVAHKKRAGRIPCARPVRLKPYGLDFTLRLICAVEINRVVHLLQRVHELRQVFVLGCVDANVILGAFE